MCAGFGADRFVVRVLYVHKAFARLNARVKDVEERVTTNATPALESRLKVAEEMWSGEVSMWFGFRF